MAGTIDRNPAGRQTGGSVDHAEVAHFERIAADWWDPQGVFKPLHRMNPVRIGYLRDHLCRHFGRDSRSVAPFAGLTLVDVGCGGGLLTEPMARLGAEVIGLDASPETIKVAAYHAERLGLPIDYRHATAEDLADTGSRFDVVLALEIVEHVADVPAFATALSRLAKPGGVVALSTLNRTAKSFALAIVGAEYVLRWVPRGTHRWRKFLRPSELAGSLRREGLIVEDVAGMVYRPVDDTWHLTARDLDVNYLMFTTKPAAAKAAA